MAARSEGGLSRTWRGFLLILLSMLVSTASGFACKIVIARRLGPDPLAVFTLSCLLMALLGTFCDLGLRQCLVSLLPRESLDDRTHLERYFRVALVFKLATTAVVSAAGYLFSESAAVHVFGKPALTPFLRLTSLGLLVWSAWDYIETYLQVHQRFGTTAVLRMLTEVARLVSLGMLARLHALETYEFLAFYVALPLVAVAAGFVVEPLRFETGGSVFDRGATADLLRLGRWNFVYRALTLLLLSLDSLMLGRFVSLSEMGLYEAAKGLAYVLILVNESMGYVLLPRLSGARSAADVRRLTKRFALSLALLSVIALLVALVGPLVLSLFGARFTQASTIEVFRLLVPACLVGAVSTYVATLLLTDGRPGRSAAVLVMQALLGMVAYPFAIRHGGIVGAAATNLTVASVGAGVFVWQYLRAYPMGEGAADVS